MVSRVLYRPFDTEDFDAIALILQQLWHNNSDNDEYNRLEAACDLSFVRATIRTNNRLLESSPLPHDNEVTLLAVDRDVHGLGVGTVLLDAAVSHLSSLGATRAHLYTDSNCSWKFYELHGFKRTATHRANREERRHDMPRESFLYELDLTA